MVRIMRLNQRMLSIVALLSRTDGVFSKGFENFLAAFLYGTLLTLVVSSVVYSLQHSESFLEFVEAFYIFWIFTMFSTVYICFVMGKATIKELLDDLQDIVESRIARYGQSERYARTENLMSWFTIRYFIAIMTAFGACFVVPLMIVIYALAAGTYSQDVLFLPYKMALPYNMKSPAGYSATFCLQLFIGIVGLSSYCIVSTYFIGICAYVHTGISDIEQHLYLLFGECSNRYIYRANLLKQQILLHGRLYDILVQFSNLMQGPIFITFLSCLATLCTTLFLIQTTAENFDYMLIQLVLINLVLTSYLFVFCFIGTIMTYKCSSIADVVYDTKWYLSSVEHQRYVILILARTQKPFYFHGFKFVVCSLMSFKSVMNLTFSFFMVLRNAS